jgi:hypothetical protein
MSTTGDRPAGSTGRSADPEPPHAPDDVRPDDRETVWIDVRPRVPQDSGPAASQSPRPARGGPGGQRTEDRETVRLDLDRSRERSADRAADRQLANRETVHLPVQRGRPTSTGRAPLAVAAAFATLWAALLSYLPVAVAMGFARSFEGAGGILGSARVGLGAWLLGHGVPLGTTVGPVGLTPLLLTLLAVWRLNRAGVHVTRAVGARNSGSIIAAVTVAFAIGIGYALLGVLAAYAASTPGMTVAMSRAGGTFGVIGFLAALFGALRSTGAVAVPARRTPRALRHGLRTGVVAALFVLAAGAGFTGLSVAVGGGQAAEMIGAYRTGVVGQAGITLVSLAYGANAAVWATSYLLGPGFLLGVGTTVRLTEVDLGPLPTLPLLAGLPEGPVGATGAGLLAFPVMAGMAAGWMLTRGLSRGREGAPRAAARTGTDPDAPGWAGLLGAAALAGPVAGALLGLLAWVSGGSLGSGRLEQIGPVPWQVAAVGTAVITVSVLIGAAATRGFRTTGTS